MPPLRAEADRSRPLGHARIVLRGVPEGADLRFCLIRDGYAAAHLGQRGWQLGEALLEPAAVESEGGAPVLVLPPALVRHVEPGPLTLRLPALGRDLALFWPADIAVYDAGDDRLVLAQPLSRPSQTPPPTPPQTPKPAVEPPKPDAAPAPLVPGPAKPAPRRWLVAAGVAVAAAAAAGGWLLLGEGQGPREVAQAPAAGLPAGERTPSPPAPWPEGTDQLTLAEIVARAPNAEGILAAALRRQAAGRHDDALVLFEEAADRRVPGAFTALGRLYDPNGFRPGQPFTSPDLRQAADYYRRAAAAGDTQVLPLRAALRTYLEQAAAAGNVTAAEALREFWP